MTKIYRATVIGAGRIGMKLEADPVRKKPATHTGAWLNNSRTKLVGLCDVDSGMPLTASRIAPGVATYSDPRKMLLEQKPDIVSIATHQDTHNELIKIAIESGARAIVCEKPISDDPIGAARVIKQAEDAGVALIINHARRFDPTFQRLAEKINTEAVGELLQISGYYVYGLVSTGTHLIDTMRMLLTQKAGEMMWVSAWHFASEHFHPPGDINIDGVIGFESGLKATVQSLNIKDYDFMEINIFGRKGKAQCYGIGRRAAIYPVVASRINSGFTEIAENPFDAWGPSEQSFFELMSRNVIDCLDGKSQPKSTGKDSLMALKVLKSMQESAAANGKVIEL